MEKVYVMGNNLQSLATYSNQPQGNPEDAALQELAAQAQSKSGWIQPYGMPQAQGLQSPSEPAVGFLQGRYDNALKISQGDASHGLGALAGGIASMILAPKVARVQQQAEANRIREADVALKHNELINQQTELGLKKTKSELNLADANMAYGAVQSGERNPDTLRKAGVSLKPDGSIKTNMDYFNEAVASGKTPFNMASLIPHNAALITEMQRPHSSLTQDKFDAMLMAASKEKDAYDKELIQAQKGKFKDQYEGLKTLSSLIDSTGKMVTNFLDPKLQDVGGPMSQALMMESLVPGLLAIKKTAKLSGIQGADDIDVKQLFDASKNAAGTEAPYKQDPTQLLSVLSQLRDISSQTQTLQQKPKDSPDRVKTTKPPLPVGTNAAPPKDIAPPKEPAKVDIFDVGN